jgi:hypothetical protein
MRLKEVSALMSDAGDRDRVSAVFGTITLVLGVLAGAATVFVYVLSLSEDFNPPNWIRVVGLVWLPVGFFGAPILYTRAHNGPGRRRGQVGLSVAAIGLVAFVVLLFAVG